MFEYYVDCFKKYATFSGRARRKEFWFFALCNFLVNIVIGLSMSISLGLGIALYVIYNLAVIIPSLAVLVRRLHDTNRSGVWFFISFVPVIGGIWLFALTLMGGTRGENNYGPDPKA